MKEMTPTGRLWPFLGIVMLLVLVAGLALPGLDRVRTASGDAIFYQYYINFFLKAPVSEYPRLFDIYFNQPQHTGFTTPIRPGYILPLALLARIIGPSFFLMARVSLAAHLGTVLLAWFFLSRWQGPVVGLATAALVAFSPLLLGTATSPLMDGYNFFFFMLCTGLFIEAVRSRGRILLLAAFGAVFAFFLVVRENNVLFVIPFFLFCLYERFFQKKPLPLFRFGIALGLPCFLALGAYIAITGSPSGLIRIVRLLMSVGSSNPYTRATGLGPWYRYLIDFLTLSPATTVLAICYFGFAVLGKPSAGLSSELRFFLIFLPVLLIIYAPLPKCVRYLCVLDLPIRLFCVLFIHEWLERAPGAKRYAIFSAVVAGLCFLDFSSYDYLFVESNLYDPISQHLLYYRFIINS